MKQFRFYYLSFNYRYYLLLIYYRLFLFIVFLLSFIFFSNDKKFKQTSLHLFRYCSNSSEVRLGEVFIVSNAA